MVVPPPARPKARDGNLEKRHVFSRSLQEDRRAAAPPRLVESVQVLRTGDEERMFFVKVYDGGLGAAGSELVTLSCVNTGTGVEAELRFDEKFPIAIRRREQSDAQRVEHVVDQVRRAGGFEELLKTFRSVFPKIEI